MCNFGIANRISVHRIKTERSMSMLTALPVFLRDMIALFNYWVIFRFVIWQFSVSDTLKGTRLKCKIFCFPPNQRNVVKLTEYFFFSTCKTDSAPLDGWPDPNHKNSHTVVSILVLLVSAFKFYLRCTFISPQKQRDMINAVLTSSVPIFTDFSFLPRLRYIWRGRVKSLCSLPSTDLKLD